MFKNTITTAIQNFVPKWSSSLVTKFNWDSQYTMGMNIIINEFIKMTFDTFTDDSIYKITKYALYLVCIYFILNYLHQKFGFLNRIFTPSKNITFIGFEKYSDNNKIFNLEYPSLMLGINTYLIEKEKISNLRFINNINTNYVVDFLENYKLTDFKNIKITINKTVEKDLTTINYILISNYKNELINFINFIKKNYLKKNMLIKTLSLTGEETNTSIKYSEVMKAISYVLINEYKFNKIKLLGNNFNENDSNKNNNNNNEIKKKGEVKETESKNSKAYENFILDNCNNFKIKDDLKISISREFINNITKVTYILSSKNINLINFTEECQKKYIEYYKNISKYKYKLNLNGNLVLDRVYLKYNTYYPKELLALSSYLYNQNKLNKFEINYYSSSSYKVDDKEINTSYLICDNITNFEIEKDIYFSFQLIKDCPDVNSNKVIYTLESNKNILNDFMAKIMNFYENFSKKITDNSLFHFTYNGNKSFSKKFISSINDENKLYENFDNLHNEHKDILIKDINRLKDLDYYKRTGLRRKKSYLFYGIPGCGKTSSVMAMALYDNRHIIEIPFNLIKTCEDLDYILNVEEINNVKITKSNSIFLFDEIDSGTKILEQRKDNSKVEINKSFTDEQNIKDIMMINALANLSNNKESNNILTSNKLTIGTILSKLDGIGNYNGMIIVATTNHIENLDPALYRELRLTPIHFTYLRKQDACEIIEKFFNLKLSKEQINLIPDRKLTPVRLIFLCEKYENTLIDIFFKENFICDN